mgnify:CR=1 FL=1
MCFQRIPACDIADISFANGDQVTVIDGLQANNDRQISFVDFVGDGVSLSLADLRVIVLENQRLMTKEEAEPAIRTFLTKMYDDAQKQTGF